jgi:hypothetical protein
VAHQALFEGLVVDEDDRPVDVVHISGEAFYVVDDDGFLRHIESEAIDRPVLQEILSLIEGHEDFISKETMEMLGQDDPFTKAVIERSLQQAGDRLDELFEVGLPETVRVNLGMVGFRVVVNYRGEVVKVIQAQNPDGE